MPRDKLPAGRSENIADEKESGQKCRLEINVKERTTKPS